MERDTPEFIQWFNNHRIRLSQIEPHYRADTFLAAFRRLYGRQQLVIVETGCTRKEDDGGDGAATLMSAEFLQTFSPTGKLFSIDIDPKNVECAQQLLQKQGLSHLVTMICDDSVNALAKLNEKGVSRIDLLYLDSKDCDPNNEQTTIASQEHCMRELNAAMPYLHKGSVLLLDDGQLPYGGKSRITKTYLLQRPNEWKCVLDSYQSVWDKLS